MFGYIYLTTNLVNGRKYIGQRQWHDEQNIFEDGYLGSGIIFKQALKKYGEQSFKKEILCICDSKEDLDLREKEFISSYHACNNPEVYNIHEGGSGGNTRKGYTDEEFCRFVRKCSQSHKGKRVSQKTRIKISEATKGEKNPNHISKLTEEQLDMMRKRVMGSNNPQYGKKPSAESIEKMRQKLLGRPSPNRGKVMSEEQKLKISRTCKDIWSNEVNKKRWIADRIGQKRSLQARQNLSEGAYKRYGTIPFDNNIVIEQYNSQWELIKRFNGIDEYYNFFHTKTCRNLKKAVYNRSIFRNSYWKISGLSTIETASWKKDPCMEWSRVHTSVNLDVEVQGFWNLVVEFQNMI